jgi:hypothetical protein
MRLHAAVVLLLASCAASPSRERVVLLATDDYGCGAEPGLGCGLAIAPVLAQLDGLEGVEESRVSWDGRTFRIALLPDADGERVTSAVVAVLGGGAERVAQPAPPAGADGERWLSSAQTIELSLHEASVLAAAFAVDIAAEAELRESDARRLETTLREELEGAFRRAHAAGGTVDRLWAEFPEARSRFEARLVEFMTPEGIARVSAFLDRELGA